MNAHEHGAVGEGFAADVGDGFLDARGDADRRQAVVREAFASLLQIRRLMNHALPDPLSLPADWERSRMMRAIALALEAAGIPPSALDAEGNRAVTGYRITETEYPQTVRVHWLGPHGSGVAYQAESALQRCATVLGDLGWTVLQYKAGRGKHHLDVEVPSSFRRRL